MSDWNPSLYLKFKNERTRPVHDLIGHIDLDAPGRILDIGCGPGNSSAVLAERYPGSEIIGLDSSPAMIERAKKECLKARFLTEDGSKDLSHLGKFDLIFANASLQWMPDHARLLRGYVKMLQKGGAIAMQIPEFLQMPAAKILAGAAASLQFAGFFRDFDPGLHENPPEYYYNALSRGSTQVNLWETYYYHVLPDCAAITEWLSSTGMKPYLDRLPEQSRPEFVRQVQAGFNANYPMQDDGRVLFIFRRLFFIAYC